MKPQRSLKEALIALGLIAFGLICLPGMVFFVGQQIIGEYELGILGLYEAMADALASGSSAAWFLVLSPLLVVELWRFARWLRRPSSA
ncbi:MAG: hypothetical protein PVH89_04605 [Gammaproteobacteria bacterium]|jgi:hypothetical protein